MAIDMAVLEAPAGDRRTDDREAEIPSYRVLGIRVHAVQIPDVLRLIERWVGERVPRAVVLTGMHGVTEAQHDRSYFDVVNAADLCVADGWPVMMMGRLAGHTMARRVYGPELMLECLDRGRRVGLRHFFYGGAPGVADAMAERLVRRFPGLQVAGTHSPPFGPVRAVEDPAVVEKIESSRADVVWVGLGTPKQERWIVSRRAQLRVPVLIGVGAAFDMHAGRLRQAPSWMQERGLEWLFRLAVEPRRLWRRYILCGSEFVVRVLIDVFTGKIKRGR